jgi:hypothetical protein
VKKDRFTPRVTPPYTTKARVDTIRCREYG